MGIFHRVGAVFVADGHCVWVFGFPCAGVSGLGDVVFVSFWVVGGVLVGRFGGIGSAVEGGFTGIDIGYKCIRVGG